MVQPISSLFKGTTDTFYADFTSLEVLVYRRRFSYSPTYPVEHFDSLLPVPPLIWQRFNSSLKMFALSTLAVTDVSLKGRHV